MRVAIVGGGLAGCAAAYVLKQAGHDPVIYEAGDALANGASGNPAGLYNPRFGAEWSAQSQYFSSAFREALSTFEHFDDIDFDPCGCLHLINDEKKERRFSKMVESWEGVDMRLVDADAASEIAGIEIGHEALYLPRSGTVSPVKLCQAYADGVEVRLNAAGDPVEDPRFRGESKEYDVVILAAGPALRGFEETRDMDLRAVRGQVSFIKEALPLKTNLCYGGYMTKAVAGQHMVGSTFQRWLDHSEIIDADDGENIGNLRASIPAASEGLEVVGHRASVRLTSRDHFPVVGQVSDKVYVSAAHGSHGILSSLMAAHILAATIDGGVSPVSGDVLKALSPQRFLP